MRMLTCREDRLFACLPACLQVGAAPVGAPRLAGDGLLREETCRGNHREAAVGELLLLHEEAERGEHRNAAMGELGLAVAVDLELGLALEEAGRVEIARRAEVAREACTKGDASR